MKNLKYLLINTFFLSTLLFAQFPLEVNNRWDFAAGEWNGQGPGKSDTLTFRIFADTVMSNGYRYYRISPEYWFHDFMRADSAGIYCYDTVNKKEWLFYKYDLEPAYNSYPNAEHLSISYQRNINDTSNYIQIYKWADYKIFLFGDSVNVYSYFYNTGLDDSRFIEISPQYGFIGIDQSDFFGHYNLFLIGCSLSGKIYGELTSTGKDNLPLKGFALYQNYSNPFNPTTTIKYQIPKPGLVQLKVYDVLGREVTTLVNEEKSSGNYEVIFNGSKLASGVYYYQLKTGEYISTKKMILMK